MASTINVALAAENKLLKEENAKLREFINKGRKYPFDKRYNYEYDGCVYEFLIGYSDWKKIYDWYQWCPKDWSEDEKDKACVFTAIFGTSLVTNIKLDPARFPPMDVVEQILEDYKIWKLIANPAKHTDN